MKSILITLISLALAVSAQADLKKIQGTWKATAGQLGDFSLPKSLLDKMVLIIKDDTYDYDEGHGHDVGKLKEIKDSKPLAMDIFGTEGPNKGKTIPTIYKLEDKVLTICYGLDGKRPKSFEDKGKRILLMTFKLPE
ncbi:MAG: TIGR03067 domain-containing protein [Armatimonadetes bacterium]|nr:TIGR03067 domain-containing protein [Armatimonadota bacterium]